MEWLERGAENVRTAVVTQDAPRIAWPGFAGEWWGLRRSGSSYAAFSTSAVETAGRWKAAMRIAGLSQIRDAGKVPGVDLSAPPGRVGRDPGIALRKRAGKVAGVPFRIPPLQRSFCKGGRVFRPKRCLRPPGKSRCPGSSQGSCLPTHRPEPTNGALRQGGGSRKKGTDSGEASSRWFRAGNAFHAPAKNGGQSHFPP